MDKRPLRGDMVIVRGGGDIATGIIQKFYRANMRVAILEIAAPTAIRRTVALCTAVYNGESAVEDMRASLANSADDFCDLWASGIIPVLVDPKAQSIASLKPDCLIDAILAKRNIGTNASMASVVIGIGPGFCAPKDAHAVIETMRGHNLGRVIFNGSALEDTGIPGEIGGKSSARVLRSPVAGKLRQLCAIGDIVTQGQGIFEVEGEIVRAPFSGVLRGLLNDNTEVTANMKCADIDPREDSDCYSISDKARAIGGGALEAYLYFKNRLLQGDILA